LIISSIISVEIIIYISSSETSSFPFARLPEMALSRVANIALGSHNDESKASTVST
jgi:hypothetical protein